MISAILLCGVLAVLVTALIHPLSETYRGMICWTFAALSSVLAAAVYFSDAREFSPDFNGLAGAAAAFGLTAVSVLAIELFAPSKRLKNADKRDYNRAEAEKALNVVLAITAGAATAAGCTCGYLGATEFSIIGIVPLAAISIRQLSYFLYRVKLDLLSADEASVKRGKLLKTLSQGKHSL